MIDLSLLEKFIEQTLSQGLGLDLTDPNLAETPQRIARMYEKQTDWHRRRPVIKIKN